jgi:hypothetical protein
VAGRAAKRTEINTPRGIADRRLAVVEVVNATLAAAGMDKRYTALSNRERGMATPKCGKVGQRDTAIARRLAALEAREAQLGALREHVGCLRQTLLEAADRLKAARRQVMRRLAQEALALSQDEAERIMPAEFRERIRAELEHAYDFVDSKTAAADKHMVRAHWAVRSRLHQAATQIRMPMAGPALEHRRATVIKRLNVGNANAVATISRIQADLDQGRPRIAIEEQALSLDTAPADTVVTPVDRATAILSSEAIAAAENAKAVLAAPKIAESLAKKAMVSRKRAAGVMKVHESALGVSDSAERTSDPSIVAPRSASSDRGQAQHDRHDQHDQHRSKEERRGTSTPRQNKALPSRRPGLRPPAGLAGLRVLRAFGVDDRPPETPGVPPDVRGGDVRRGPEVHLEVRGAPADRVSDAPDVPPFPLPENAPVNPIARRSLANLAAQIGQSANGQTARSKGRTVDHGAPAVQRGKDSEGR